MASGQDLLSLINDILDISKIEAREMYLDIEKVNVAELLDKSFSLIWEKASVHSIDLATKIDKNIDYVYLDK